MNKKLGIVGIAGIIGIFVMILLLSTVNAQEDKPITFVVGEYGKFIVTNTGQVPIFVLDNVSIVDRENNIVATIQDFPEPTLLKIYAGKSYSWELKDKLGDGYYRGKTYWGYDNKVLSAEYTEEFQTSQNSEKFVWPTFTIPRPTFTWPRPTVTPPVTPTPTVTPTVTITPTVTPPSGRVQVKFYTDKSVYNKGEEVELIMKNTGTLPVYVHVPDQLQDPWTVKKIGGTDIIHIDTGCEYGYGQSCDYLALYPGEIISYSWDQKNDNGIQVPSGTYKAYARYTKDNPGTVANPNMVTKTATFTIRR